MTFRIERGVRRDEVSLVENIRGLGRHRVRKLREYLNRPDIAGVDQMPDGSLWEQLTAFYDGLDNPHFFVETLSGNVSGVGKRTANRIEEFVSDGSIDDEYLETDDEGVSSVSDSSGSSGNYNREPASTTFEHNLAVSLQKHQMSGSSDCLTESNSPLPIYMQLLTQYYG